MGRELKRVPMDFDLPIGKVWPGYLTEGDDDPAEPPEGDGFQMWETCSEGSPISPVFATAEELARWLADTGASASGDMTATYDQWLATIKVGWAPTMVMVGGRMVSGVEFVAESRAQPVDLPAGPEMDRAVALALGWKERNHFFGSDGKFWIDPHNMVHTSCPEFSADPRMQGELLAAIHGAFPVVSMHIYPAGAVAQTPGRHGHRADGPTINLALCRLWLAVKGAQ